MKTSFAEIHNEIPEMSNNKFYNFYIKSYIRRIPKAKLSPIFINFFAGQIDEQISLEAADEDVLRIILAPYKDMDKSKPCQDHFLLSRCTVRKGKEIPAVYIFMFISYGDLRWRNVENLCEYLPGEFAKLGEQYGVASLMTSFEHLKSPRKCKSPNRFQNNDLKSADSWINHIFPFSEKSSNYDYLIASHSLEPGVDLPINPQTGKWEFPKDVAEESPKISLLEKLHGKGTK